jgi:enoyl-CoA hydratase/3-hydroxyacyl-CoA dehydrogenase
MDVDDINTIAVLGAGNMGHGIAEVAALAGFEVRLRDIDRELVQEGYDQIEWSLGKLAEKDQIGRSEADAALERIAPVVDLGEAVGEADVVIEAVPEKMEIKKDVYASLEEVAPDRTIFATNTSSLSITELADVTDRPEQFCGMHFFNPPVRMELVEVISGAESAEETLDAVADLAEEMGKTPVRVRRDSPGFVVNRILIPLMNESAWLVERGEATVAEVDSTTKYGMGIPMGSFELADQVGIDVGLHVLEYMHEVLGDAYRPCPLLEEKVEAETLGKKTGEGFYDYDDGGAEVPSDAVDEEIQRRLVAVMANEVAGLLADDVADVTAIDRAMKLGAGFPDGPARMADDEGIEALVETLDELHEETGDVRYEVVDHLRDLAEAGEGFYGPGDDGGDGLTFDAVHVDVDGRVGHVAIDRPHRMNSISTEVLSELEEVVEMLEDDDGVRAILLTGRGDRAFSAGADVQSMIASGADPLRGVELSKHGQRVFGLLESSDLPVVAGVDGYCLGGGMELAMCADLRIASRRSEFGQPEHNLGLLPGWGGTQRLQRIVGMGRAKEIILTGERFDAETMREYGFVTEVTDSDSLLEEARALAEKLADGPPVAQRYTKRAMLRGWDDVEAGLEIEAQAFGHIAASDDAMEGVTAFMSDREPEFEGS